MKGERVLYLLVILGLSTILVLDRLKCSGSAGCPPCDQTVRVDTVTKTDSSAWVEKPTPKKITPWKITPGRIKTSDPVVDQDTLPFWIAFDTTEIIEDYFSTKDYSQTYDFDYGSILVENSVSENSLQKQRVLPTWKLPVKTIETIYKDERRGQLFVGVDVYGNKNTTLNGLGGSIMYLHKKDIGIEVGSFVLKNQGIHYRAGLKIGILRRQRI